MSNKKESAVIADIPEPPAPPPVTNVCGKGLIPCHPKYDIPPLIPPPPLITHPSNDEDETGFRLYHFFLLSIGFSLGLLVMKFINHFC